jgi:hypothetical protein
MNLAALLLIATRKVRRAFYARPLDARRAGPPWERSVQPNLSEWRQSAYSSHYWRQRKSVLLTSESSTGLIFLQLVQ